MRNKIIPALLLTGMTIRSTLAITLILSLSSCFPKTDSLKEEFITPPNEYRPMPFWHLNGHLTKDEIEKQIREAKELSGFGGVTVLPVTPGRQHPTGLPCPGMTPEFLSEEYFDRYLDILSSSKKQGTEVILYDDIDFPSGSAGGRLHKEYPQYTRKFLVKEEFMARGNQHISKPLTRDSSSFLMAISAMDTTTHEVLDLQPFMQGSTLEWEVPAGNWRIMLFSCDYSVKGSYGKQVDYMQPEAVSKVMEMTYAKYEKHLGSYFGNVITKTFFDDVGFVFKEETWTPSITEIFEECYGKNPALYYPALYYDIGPETQSARVAFYDIRSELMAEGYVKQISQWSEDHHLRSMGHPPENYSPNSVVAHGDILKYYRHVQIPLTDAILFYGRGINGFKQISSAADLGDKPLVGAELCGALPADMDSLMLYRVLMEVLVRGVNFVVPHGMWYDPEPTHVRIPPLISHENTLLKDCLPAYSLYTARSCRMLQGGRRISDIALLWPITAVQAESYINRDKNSGMGVAQWVPENVNHTQLSALLSNEIRRDFTYIHPEDLINGKISAHASELVLNNTTNIQKFKVLIMPGGDVISAESLKAIKDYYDQGGKVIATASLPHRSAEFNRDAEVQQIISEMHRSNAQGGEFAFLPDVTKESLSDLLKQMGISADVHFEMDSDTDHELGYFNYIHKNKEGKDIYFFTNTTEKPISTTISIRGKLKQPELWNPHTGTINKLKEVKQIKQPDGTIATRITLNIPAVSSLFIVGS